ncbi:MAG TPA: hypothetical protein VG820_13260, partial [Fimbriimonadaceae bacterium]|nr:hypothetical protein [Fimbriimonadaceae bacterium]
MYLVLPDDPDGPQRIELQDSAGRVIASDGTPYGALRTLALQWRTARSSPAPLGPALESLGSELSQLVFRDRILAALQRAAGEHFYFAAPLRLGIRCESALMRELPWEVSSIRAGSAADPLDGPLALHPRVRLFRVGQEADVRSPEPPRNLRVLVASADPGTPRYRLLAWI